MSKDTPSSSALVAAAVAFDSELARYERLTDALTKAPLDSEKHLERAAATLAELADTEDRLGRCAQQLMGSLAEARDRQQGQAGVATARAHEIEARSRVFQDLLARFAELGDEAAALNKLGGEMSAAAPADREGAEKTLLPQLDTLHARMTGLADRSLQVAEDAKTETFGELARKAHELRQQLLAARNKVGLLQQKLTS